MALSSIGGIRKFVFQNASSGKTYEVILKRSLAGAVSGKGRKLADSSAVSTDPSYDKTEISFVVLTAEVAKFENAYHDTYLAQAAIYDATDVGGAGAALSTLLT